MIEERGERERIIRYKGGLVLKTQSRNAEDSYFLEEGDVWVRDGKVIDPQKLFYEEKRLPDEVVDCTNLIVAPGFIDIQINGIDPDS